MNGGQSGRVAAVVVGPLGRERCNRIGMVKGESGKPEKSVCVEPVQESADERTVKTSRAMATGPRSGRRG
ncbi:hypothetical protein GGTG_02178 [Gaeumannomyces tritici R3-111a-1]|uniref:Uncharacterized protein n=1 Tax=Gaeumannomyces tritici (strain R3-111a-1) TaxID=644352 RepID=J3NLM9_GAET3|nr:hypothetical protein GGTG_02178 [Gaeumannomyces tritici R3-111a-1]EJT82204.1 hypothetical protein GGTG_02178 [Gaeumannomyces tritici R3-111a-1]